MSTLDYIDNWVLMHRAELDANGIETNLRRSPTDWLDPSCYLLFRRGDVEAELASWASGNGRRDESKSGRFHKYHALPKYSGSRGVGQNVV